MATENGRDRQLNVRIPSILYDTLRRVAEQRQRQTGRSGGVSQLIKDWAHWLQSLGDDAVPTLENQLGSPAHRQDVSALTEVLALTSWVNRAPMVDVEEQLDSRNRRTDPFLHLQLPQPIEWRILDLDELVRHEDLPRSLKAKAEFQLQLAFLAVADRELDIGNAQLAAKAAKQSLAYFKRAKQHLQKRALPNAHLAAAGCFSLRALASIPQEPTLGLHEERKRAFEELQQVSDGFGIARLRSFSRQQRTELLNPRHRFTKLAKSAHGLMLKALEDKAKADGYRQQAVKNFVQGHPYVQNCQNARQQVFAALEAADSSTPATLPRTEIIEAIRHDPQLLWLFAVGEIERESIPYDPMTGDDNPVDIILRSISREYREEATASDGGADHEVA